MKRGATVDVSLAATETCLTFDLAAPLSAESRRAPSTSVPASGLLRCPLRITLRRTRPQMLRRVCLWVVGVAGVEEGPEGVRDVSSLCGVIRPGAPCTTSVDEPCALEPLKFNSGGLGGAEKGGAGAGGMG